jgi:hypothetical protein
MVRCGLGANEWHTSVYDGILPMGHHRAVIITKQSGSYGGAVPLQLGMKKIVGKAPVVVLIRNAS